MAHSRRFRFGVQARAAADGDNWVSLARRAEELGYSSLLMPDHFGDQLAPVPALAAAATATETLRVGGLVLDNDYRHPVVLAKEMATLDVLSGGRLEFGLGAGWMATDYQQSGIALELPGVRIDRMIESLQIIRGLWGPGPVDFDGDHYRISGLDGHPKPVQQPHPPVMIGGGGRRVLSLAAQEADIVGLNPRLTAGEVGPEAAKDAVADRVDTKVAWVRDAAGARYDDLELSMLVLFCLLTDERRATVEALAGGFGLTVDEATNVPHAWVGTIDEIADQVQGWRDRWDVSYWVIHSESMEDMAPLVERLAGT